MEHTKPPLYSDITFQFYNESKEDFDITKLLLEAVNDSIHTTCIESKHGHATLKSRHVKKELRTYENSYGIDEPGLLRSQISDLIAHRYILQYLFHHEN